MELLINSQIICKEMELLINKNKNNQHTFISLYYQRNCNSKSTPWDGEVNWKIRGWGKIREFDVLVTSRSRMGESWMRSRVKSKMREKRDSIQKPEVKSKLPN